MKARRYQVLLTFICFAASCIKVPDITVPCVSSLTFIFMIVEPIFNRKLEPVNLFL